MRYIRIVDRGVGWGTYWQIMVNEDSLGFCVPQPHPVCYWELILGPWTYQAKTLPIDYIPATPGVCSLHQSNMCSSPGHSHEGQGSWFTPGWPPEVCGGNITGCWPPPMSPWSTNFSGCSAISQLPRRLCNIISSLCYCPPCFLLVWSLEQRPIFSAVVHSPAHSMITGLLNVTCL